MRHNKAEPGTCPPRRRASLPRARRSSLDPGRAIRAIESGGRSNLSGLICAADQTDYKDIDRRGVQTSRPADGKIGSVVVTRRDFWLRALGRVGNASGGGSVECRLRGSRCMSGVRASASALAPARRRHDGAMHASAEAWGVDRSRLGAACAAVCAVCWAASALDGLIVCLSRVESEATPNQEGCPVPGNNSSNMCM